MPVSSYPYDSIRRSCLVAQLLGNHAEVEIPSGSMLVGFGKGKFRAAKDDIAEREVSFKLQSSSDVVSLGGVFATVNDVINQKRKTVVAAGVCYHEMVEIAGTTPPEFELTQV
jgi:hypothetical protein